MNFRRDRKIDFGKVRIEYREGADIVRIYNFPKACSLVVNGKVMDGYWGLSRCEFDVRVSV